MAKVVTTSEFTEVIKSLKGCQFASLLYTTTKESLNKRLIGGKSNPYHNTISSVTEISGIQIGANYENAVNNRIVDDTTFKAEKLPWGEWIRPNYLIAHKGETYLRAYKTKGTKADTTYYTNGTPVSSTTATEIAKNIRKPQTSQRQAEVGIAEADMVMPFTLNISSIVKAAINGVTYIILP